MDYQARLEWLSKKLAEQEADGMIVGGFTSIERSRIPNVEYLCGFTGSEGTVIAGPQGAFLITDGRYTIQAANEVKGAEVRIFETSADRPELLQRSASDAGITRAAFESGIVSVDGLNDLKGYLPEVELVPVKDVVEELRQVKQPEEIELIREAAKMADAAFEWIVGKVEVGKTERDLALDLEMYIRRNGAEAVSFDSIVAAAERSALPHADPTNREVEKGHFLLLDFGCLFKGYCSDLTRTVAVGPVDDRHHQVYEAVLASNEAGIAAVKPGAGGHDVDAAARGVLEEAGFGDAFAHGLGHAVGLEVHESPRLTRGSEDVLIAGNVVTIEPGAYFEGWGGVRIEDLVLVTQNGADVLSSAPKDLIQL
ncbi:MAG TPA: aminopeptidase P family protein [Actinomycetota bacterium]|nr:aminopeptidase P family protein [Actinomycetota bacterium]